jgi:hypothetical protein
MADTTKKVKTNGDFVGVLLKTKSSIAADAKSLLSDFPGFKAWLQLPATSESMECIAEVFSARACTTLKSLMCFEVLFKEKLKNVREFLLALGQIGSTDFDAEISLAEANSILDQMEESVTCAAG